MIPCNDKYVLLFCLIVLIENGKATSIMNDVKIGNNELKPPTVFNTTNTRVNATANNNKSIEMLMDMDTPPTTPHVVTSKGHDGNYLHWHGFPSNQNEIIGSTLMDLSGLSQVDNTETMLGDTVADAFLMNSWDDTEIRYTLSCY